MTGQVTRVTVKLMFWKRDGKKGSGKFIWREVIEDVVMGIGYEERLKKIVGRIESEGWKVFWNKYRIIKYHYD